MRAALETPLDVRLEPAGVGETVQVTADAGTAGLNKTNPTIATSINARAVEELPLPGGRNINNLVLTVPNASSTTGQGTYAINGNRPRNNNYMVDGSDNNDISVTIATSQIVPESVAEFQVMQNPYSVEFGRNSGGQINVITKSGSNRFRGDFFDYYQSSGLNSRTNIEKANNLTTPPEAHSPSARRRSRRPGARATSCSSSVSISGTRSARPTAPVRRRSGSRRRPATRRSRTCRCATASRRRAARRFCGRFAYLQDVYGASPVFRNVNNQLVNGVPIETGQTNVSIIDPSMYHTWLGRGDYRPFSTDTFTVRYSLNDRLDDNAISNLGFGDRFAGYQDLVDTNLAVSNAHTFSSNKLNEFRFSLVRRNLDFPENDPDSPSVTITGLFNIGGASNFPQSRITDAYQFSDTVTWSAAKHSVKFGADVRLNNVINNAAFDSKGTFTFDNLQAYMNNNALAGRAGAADRRASRSRQWQSFFFVQDDFRLSSGADAEPRSSLRVVRRAARHVRHDGSRR